jgi:hypothetical protein
MTRKRRLRDIIVSCGVRTCTHYYDRDADDYLPLEDDSDLQDVAFLGQHRLVLLR